MASDRAQGTPSPSASSIFLPLGRISRRNSKSSLNNSVDRNTLNEALDHIHTAASTSQSLTVFNDYTNPPAVSSANEGKGLAEEVQGGLSGLYNKLIASVTGTKGDSGFVDAAADTRRVAVDGTPPVKLVTDETTKEHLDGVSHLPASTLSSRVQSPVATSFDLSASEIRPKPSKLTSKAPSTFSKHSGPTTPPLKSPVTVAQKSAPGNVPEPSISELNIDAYQSQKLHSRNTSTQEPECQKTMNDEAQDVSSQLISLRKVISGTVVHEVVHEVVPADRDRQPLSSAPAQREPHQTSDEGRKAQENVSFKALSSPARDFEAVPEPVTILAEGQTVDRSLMQKSEQMPSTKHHGSNPLRLLDTSGEKTRAGSSVSGDVRSLLSPSSPASRPKEKLTTRVSQSHLPGFRPSRKSSLESLATGGGSHHITFARNDLDGNYELSRGNSRPLKPISGKLKSKLLSREFWMRDENAKDCFHCGEPFSTFRRKHHCRTCGQIFDNKCTSLIDGMHFGSSSSIRVCKPCEAIINAHDEDSSDESIDELTMPESATKSRTPIVQQSLKTAQAMDDDSASIVSQSLEQMAKTPTMSFPVRVALDSKSGRSAVYEFDAPDRSLPRPSSSRSLRASHSIGHNHRRHHSRHQHIRNFKAYHEERAPFQRKVSDSLSRDMKQSDFDRDSMVDPDLAQYLSDDASSDDDQSDVVAVNEDVLSKSAPDSEKVSLGGLLAAVRKGKSRLAERSIGSMLGTVRDGDDNSIISSRIANLPRPPRKRNLSVASSIHHRLSPKPTKESLGTPAHSGAEVSGPSHLVNQFAPSGASRMTRSASMHGAGAPAIELNRASLHHVRKLLRQLLQDADVPRTSNWETALLPILLKATDEVDPDVQRGDDIDIRHYVKLKKIPGGRPGDTTYVSGLVFTKNLALKSMPRAILQPKILIITFPLEYARHEQHFMSLEPVIRQEREYLQNLVGRIAALKPQLLLAQRNVSGLALEFLQKANIATVYNVKPAVLEAVSRCTRTRIIHTIDKLAVHPAQTGTCDSFEVKTFVFEGRRKKTYIYLSGCQPQLGCTITLRGAENSILSKIKRVAEFMVYVVYNLKLETCLMRDEFALIPSTGLDQMVVDKRASENIGPSETLPAVVPATNRIASEDDSFATDPLVQAEIKRPERSNADAVLEPAVRIGSADSNPIPDDVPVPKFYEDLVEKHQTKILSASPFVKFAQPYLLMRARELERRVAYLKRLRDQEIPFDQSTDEKVKAQKFTLIQPEMVHASLSGASAKVREILHAVHDAEYDKALHNYETQKKQWEAFISGNKNLFDPYAHQNIVVLFSLVSTSTSIPCSGPDILAFSFYNEHETEEQFEADCTLGQYVEDLCFRANDICTSPNCEKMMFEHHRQYVHGQAQVSVFVQPYPAKMRGMQDTVLMWSQCKICGNETPVTPMSMSTWKYSFGKYLELSFWSSALHARAGVCPHDLHRDHLRYFGYKNFALRIHYDSIGLLEIIVPRMRITWKVDNDLKFKNEVFTRIEQRLNKFMISVKSRLKGINLAAVLPEKAEACCAEIEQLAKKASEEHLALIRQLQERYSNSKHWETIPLNRAMRTTQESVADWDNAFAKFERDFFPSEKDIRRLATLQLKKIFLDRDVSVTSITSIDEGNTTPPSETTIDEKDVEPDATPRPSRPRRMTQLSPEKTQDVLEAVMKEHARPDSEEHPTVQESSHHDDVSVTSDSEKETVEIAVRDVRHLDLALPPHPPASQSESSESTTRGSPPSSSTPNLPEPISRELEPSITRSTVPSANSNGITLEMDPKRAVAVHLPMPTKLPRSNESAMGRAVAGKTVSPPLLRAQSQPAGPPTLHRESSNSKSGTMSAIHATQGFGSSTTQPSDGTAPSITEAVPSGGEKKFSERLGLNRLRNSKLGKAQSFIPRSIPGKKNSRVSNLAKHFEQLSREFEKERIRERKLRAARSRQSRVYPLASSKPIVEVYKSVDDAVQERDTSDESFMTYDQQNEDTGDTDKTLSRMADTNPAEISGDSFHVEDTPAETTETDADGHDTSRAQSDAEGDEDHSDVDQDLQDMSMPESPEDLPKMSPEDLDLKELPKHERSSLMKLLTNFWAERSSSGWTSLDYPLSSTDHVFADCDIIVREDEPSSIIAFALDSQDYKSKLGEIHEYANHLGERSNLNGASPTESNQAEVMHSLLRKTGTHLKYQFQEGPAKALCKIFFAEQFDAVRRRCGVSDRIVESLSRCMKWDSKGGKTKSLFLKTLDDRFVLKSLSPIETQSFLQFAPNYFQIMSEAFFHELPSVIAKMLGFYQIIIKNPVTGVEYNWYLLVMENLFYDRTPTRIFDLKGSMRNRKIQSTGERNEVLLDENMVDFIYESPLFTREHSKKLLRSSVHNDTLFLARQNVMDYSLMVAIDENKKELVVGIIDCIRTYTWDKKLESWIKDRGFAGGNKNRPTVTSPKEYKKRFREAMGRYVLEAPNCWHQFKSSTIEKRQLQIEQSFENKDGDKAEAEVEVFS